MCVKVRPERGVHAAIARDEGDGQHAGDREQRAAHVGQRFQEDPAEAARCNPQPGGRAQRRHEDARARGGPPVELEDGFLGLFLLLPGHHRRWRSKGL